MQVYITTSIPTIMHAMVPFKSSLQYLFTLRYLLMQIDVIILYRINSPEISWIVKKSDRNPSQVIQTRICIAYAYF